MIEESLADLAIFTQTIGAFTNKFNKVLGCLSYSSLHDEIGEN